MSDIPNLAEETDSTPGAPVMADVVTRARKGDRQAWDTLVDRYSPLIWAICRRYRLRNADADDVGQSIWLRLVVQLDKIREPAALAGWLATTTRRECIRVLRTAEPQLTGYGPPPGDTLNEPGETPEQELLAAERHATLRARPIASSEQAIVPILARLLQARQYGFHR